ncbi:MAG: hypothetical protein ACRDTH_05320 [Pseudonocardiaceae bacterium]
MHVATPAKRNVVVNRAAEITHHMLDTLRDVLLAAVTARPAADGGIGSIQLRACAVLYMLLHDHTLDRRGRCRSCRHPCALLGKRRRRCRIYVEASFWLRQPDDVVLRHLTSELNHRPTPAPGPGRMARSVLPHPGGRNP